MSGGGYGQNGGRQQRKRPRDFDDDQYRRPRTVDTLEKLKRDLVNLCDPGTIKATEDIRYVARKLAIDFAVPENQDRILSLLQDCILQLSVKTCQYAAVASLAAAQNKGFGQSFVTLIASTTLKAYAARNWRDLKLLLRVLATMDHCLATSGMTTGKLLQGLFATIQESQGKSCSHTTSKTCEVILLTLPYLVAGSIQDKTAAIASLDSLLEQLRPLVTAHTSQIPASAQATDSLIMLFQQCESASRSGWMVHYLPQFQELLGPDGISETFELAPVDFEALEDDGVSAQSKTYLELFSKQAVDTVPPADDLAASIFRDHVIDILDLLVANRKDAAKYLIDLESYMQPGIFVLRGTPLDKIPSNGPTWKAEDIVVEGIFSEMLSLPSPRHKPVYYHSVLTELCKLVPQAVAPTFGRAIRSIYGNLDNMEPELAYRAWDWFSHHLSNFGFNWKWQEWISDLTLPPLHPKSAFIRETIMKEAELSYNQRIKTTLPNEYHHLILDEAAGPNFPHAQPVSALFQETTALLDSLAGDSQPDQITALLSDIALKASEQGLLGDFESVTILVQAILQLGHQSFSHALNTVERHIDLLQSRCDADAESRRTTVAAVFQFWSGRPFIASTLLQKLLNYRIISPLSVLEYILQHGDVSSSVVWELLDTTIDKVAKRVVQVQERLARLSAQTTAQPGPVETPVSEEVEQQVDGQGKSEELMNLEKTWFDVQAEQKDVLLYTLRHFMTKLQDSRDAEEWTEYWNKGLLRSFLRRHGKRIAAMEDDAVRDPKVEAISGIKIH